MIEKILSALEKSGVKQYQVTETTKESAELFFIKKNLDMQRAANVRQAEVVVYQEFWEGERHCFGSSSVVVQESFTEEEMEGLFRDALYAAGFVKNEYYELYAGEENSADAGLAERVDVDLAELAHAFSAALFAEDVREDVFLNSAEVFAYREDTHIINSRQVDVRYRRSWVWGEFVAQCTTGQDVETYHHFQYENLQKGSLPTEALRKKVRDVLEMTRARAEATSAAPAGEYRVILPGAFLKEVMQYYISRSGSSMIYPKYSAFEIGCDVQGGEAKKDTINLRLKATVPYSSEGIPMTDRNLIKDGTLQLIHGNNRFACYLGIQPTGSYTSFQMPGGSVTIEEMKRQPYLEVVNFSDFQMDAFTGHFGGEIRLAFLYDGKSRVPVTGGSINGQILEAQRNLVFSKETQVENDFEGPAAVCLEGIRVAGAEA